MQQTIDVVKQYKSNGIRGIFHCFSGNYQNAVDIVDAGFLLGIGGVVTYKNAGVAEAIKDIDLAHIVVETDAPYLTPVPFRGKRNESSYITYVVKKLAEIKNISAEEVAMITTKNAEKILKGKLCRNETARHRYLIKFSETNISDQLSGNGIPMYNQINLLKL